MQDDETTAVSVAAALKASKVVSCYFSAGLTGNQHDEARSDQSPSLIRGVGVPFADQFHTK